MISPLKEEGKTLKEAYYTQFGAPFQGGGYRATAPGFYQRNNANPSYQERRQSIEETLSKFMGESAKRHEENSNLIKEIRALMDATINLSSSTETNPRDHDKSISRIVEADASLICQAYSYGASHTNKSIPQKEKDLGSFTLPCYTNNICFDNALADLEASISVMPLLTYLNLGLGELTHTKLTVKFADRTVKYPKGIAENCLILGRPFLSTAHAKIDVFKRKITLRVREEKIIFKSVKPASSLIKRVYMLSLRERMKLDLEARLMGETLVLNRSLETFFGDYIELNDLNVPLELRRDQVDNLMPIIEEGEVVEEFRAKNDTRMVRKFFGYHSDCDHDKKIRIDCAYNLKFSCMTGCWREDRYCNGGNLPGAFIIGNTLHYQNLEWYDALKDSKLKEEALKNKAIMEGMIDKDEESSNEVIMKYLVKVNKKACILELKERNMKISVLTTNTPYPSRKTLRICAYTSPKTTKETRSNTPYLDIYTTQIVMENPNHLNEPNEAIPEVNPVVPEPNQVVDIHDPNEMVDIPDDIDLVDYDEEDPEEDPEEEPEEDVDIELEDDAELIFPYEVEGDKTPPPGDVSSDSVSSDSESEDEEVDVVPEATAGTITQKPYAIRDFPRGLFEVGESSSARDSSHVDGLAPWALRRDLEASRAQARVMEAELGTCQTEIALLKSKNKIGEKERELLNHDLENVERALGGAGAGGAGAGGAGAGGAGAGGAGVGGAGPAAPEITGCTYITFMKCDPQPFKGTEGAVGLCQWFEKLEYVFRISDCKERDKVKFATATLQGRALTWWNGRIASMGIDAANGTPWTEVRKWMTEEFCPRSVLQRLEQELYNLKLKGTDIDGYTNRFHKSITIHFLKASLT
ncbi:hypothetical protein Tco_0256567 [Tanacetum coccineum]